MQEWVDKVASAASLLLLDHVLGWQIGMTGKGGGGCQVAQGAGGVGGAGWQREREIREGRGLGCTWVRVRNRGWLG